MIMIQQFSFPGGNIPKYSAVIFDHDGTVADAAPGILKSANAAFAEMGYPALTMEQFMPYLGPPLQNSFTQYAGMTVEQAQQAIAIYRREYAAGNCYCLRIYDGMEALLKALRAAGIKTAVASSKPTVFLEKILNHLGLRNFFDAVCGVELDRLESTKADIILAATQTLGVLPENCLMVGDRHFDVDGAKALGMPSVGVLHGYGTREELAAAGADYLAEDCAQLQKICFGDKC